MKTIIRKKLRKIARITKASLVVFLTTLGFFTTYLLALFAIVGFTLTETQFVGLILVTIFSEVLLIGWIAD